MGVELLKKGVKEVEKLKEKLAELSSLLLVVLNVNIKLNEKNKGLEADVIVDPFYFLSCNTCGNCHLSTISNLFLLGMTIPTEITSD